MSDRIDITVLTGVSKGDVFHFQISVGSSLTIGRADDCGLVLQDPTVSRRHAKVMRESDGFYLVDLGSTHGTTHMGFQLSSGEGDRRKMGDDDEFKVGDAVFRANFDVETTESSTDDTSGAAPTKQRFSVLANKKVKLGLIGAGALGLVYFLLPEGPKGLPKQATAPLSIPAERVIGNLSVGTGSGNSDRTHIDKAVFILPVADSVIEYEYLSEAPITIRIDDAKLVDLDPYTADWMRRVIVSRDVVAGAVRKLTFDNLDYPKPAGKSGPNKSWGVRDIRATPVVQTVGTRFGGEIQQTIALVEKMRRTSDGAYRLLRSVHRSMLEGLREANLDALEYEINPVLGQADEIDLKERLETILKERAADPSGSYSEYLNQLAKIASALDSELWRKTDLTLHGAQRLSRQKQYVEAYDSLKLLQTNFPPDEDHRWILAERMLNDKKVIPAKIRKNPNKFRKKTD